MTAGISAQDAEKRAAAHGWSPCEPYPGSVKTLWLVRCGTCGEQFRRSLDRITKFGCKYCKGLAKDSASAEALARSKGLEPRESYRSARTPWLCFCTRCRQQVPIYLGNLKKDLGCPGCRGQVFDLDVLNREWRSYGWEPLVPFPGRANAPWPSRCRTCKSEGAPRLANVRHRFKQNRSSSCTQCAGYTPLTDVTARIVMNNGGLVPLVPFPGKSEPWPCLCIEKGHAVSPTYKSVQRGHGCRVCNKQGFDYEAPAEVYVMANPGLYAVKIGLAGLQTRRSRKQILARDGWQVTWTMRFDTGAEAYAVEQAVLRPLRCRLTPFLPNDQMPQNGGTETFNDADIDTAELRALVTQASAALEAAEAEPQPVTP